MPKKKAIAKSGEELAQMLERYKRYCEENHEQQAANELGQWQIKWQHTQIGRILNGALGDLHNELMGGGRRRPRGPAFPDSQIVLAVTLLEKIGIAPPAAKKIVADRFCTTVRNVELYLQELGVVTRNFCNLVAARGIKEAFGWNALAHLRLTKEEVQKLNEVIFREK